MDGMRKSVPHLIVIAVFVFALAAGCTVDSEPGKSEQLQVVVSFSTLAEFVQGIAGEQAEVKVLVPSGTEVHHWEPSPKDMAALAEADLFIYNGFNMEPWLESVKSGVGEVKMVMAGAGTAAAASMPAHAADPHVWLNPLLAAGQAEGIAAALADADPEHENQYADRAKRLAQEFAELDRRYGEALIGSGQKLLLVSHGAFSYLAERYHLNQVAMLGVNADETPSPRRLAEMVELARSSGVTVVYYARGESPRLAQTLADEIGAEVLPLDPIERVFNDEETYFDRMEANLANLRKGLGN